MFTFLLSGSKSRIIKAKTKPEFQEVKMKFMSGKLSAHEWTTTKDTTMSLKRNTNWTK